MHLRQPQFLTIGWNAPRNIKTLITTATIDFNLAMHVNDDPNKVKANREILESKLPSSPMWLNQTHSIDVINWDNKKSYQIFDADASITTKAKTVCVVMTADCLPILLSNKDGDFVAAIHAGWRGLNNGIIQQTIAQISEKYKKDIIAFIGPAINQECFEIGSEVFDAFITTNPQNKSFFTPSLNQGKYLADLRGIAELILINSGVKATNITNNKICTKCNTNWFYSYRDNSNTGRFATLIWIE